MGGLNSPLTPANMTLLSRAKNRRKMNIETTWSKMGCQYVAQRDTQMSLCIHTHTYIHTHTHTYIHTHSYIHTYIYTHIHTHLSIGDLLQSGSFERCLCAILQQFGVVASVDHQTCDVASVTKLSTSQQDLVRLQGVDLIWGGPTRRGGWRKRG